MNSSTKDIAEGSWKQFVGSVRRQWGELTNDEVERSKGNLTEIIGKIQGKYGESRREIEKKLSDILEFTNEKLK